MKKILTACFLLINICVHAQTSSAVNTKPLHKQGDSVYQAADFAGGVHEWTKFMERNLNLETAANNKAPVGKYTVTVSFAIDSSGNVIEAKY